MADGPIQKETGPGKAEPPPLTPEQFENSKEFRRLRSGMRKLLKVSKAELDRRVEIAKQSSPRADNPDAPGRKRDD